jgi:hypothetical protein
VALKEKAQRRIEDNPEDRWAKNYFANKNKVGKTKKRCGYCDFRGHTRQTCKELAHAKDVAIRLTATWRKQLVEGMKEKGCGIGALVLYKANNEQALGVVTAIDWPKLNFLTGRNDHSKHHGFVVSIKSVAKMSQMYSRPESIPDIEGVYQLDSYYHEALEIVGPIKAESIEAQVPTNFCTGKDCIEAVFLENEKSGHRIKAWQAEYWCKAQGFYTDAKDHSVTSEWEKEL